MNKGEAPVARRASAKRLRSQDRLFEQPSRSSLPRSCKAASAGSLKLSTEAGDQHTNLVKLLAAVPGAGPRVLAQLSASLAEEDCAEAVCALLAHPRLVVREATCSAVTVAAPSVCVSSFKLGVLRLSEDACTAPASPDRKKQDGPHWKSAEEHRSHRAEYEARRRLKLGKTKVLRRHSVTQPEAKSHSAQEKCTGAARSTVPSQRGGRNEPAQKFTEQLRQQQRRQQRAEYEARRRLELGKTKTSRAHPGLLAKEDSGGLEVAADTEYVGGGEFVALSELDSRAGSDWDDFAEDLNQLHGDVPAPNLNCSTDFNVELPLDSPVKCSPPTF